MLAGAYPGIFDGRGDQSYQMCAARAVRAARVAHVARVAHAARTHLVTVRGTSSLQDDLGVCRYYVSIFATVRSQVVARRHRRRMMIFSKLYFLHPSESNSKKYFLEILPCIMYICYLHIFIIYAIV